jgi:hypothetical protein
MILVIESIILCFIFTGMVYIMSRDPMKTIYNYPPKIQERVKSLKEYQNQIPTQKNKLGIKLFASFLFLCILCFVLKYINGCQTFWDSFCNGFLLWTIVNLWDAIVLDMIWFCHDPYFRIKGTEDMIEEYHNYWFHIKGFFIGEGLALIIVSIAALIIQFII